MDGLIVLCGAACLGLATVQLVTGRAPTELGGTRNPGYFTKRAGSWRYWFMFWFNIALGATCIAAALLHN